MAETTMGETVTAAARLSNVQKAIAVAATEAKREAGATTLIAVSKTFGAEAIQAVIDAGQRHFGENRVQEAQGKWPALKAATPDITLHLIGPLQSNKAKEAVALFDVIHTVDRPKIARAIADESQRQGRSPSVFVQVNTGAEPQKAGILPDELPELLTQVRDLGLDCRGLMCIPPVDEAPAVHFALLAKLADECGLESLSMGMSGDYETAVQFGATHIRVGSAIFGARG